MRSKKVLFVSNTARSIYKFRLRLADVLRDKSFDIILCACPDEYAEKIKENGFRFIPVNIQRQGLNPFSDLKLIYDLYKIYKKERPDLLLHFSIKLNIYGAIAAKLAKIKCINTVTGLGYVFMKESWLSKCVKILYRVSFKFPVRVFFQNKDDLELFIKNKSVDRDKTVLVKGSGVDINRFYPDLCKQSKKNNSDFIFLFIARMLWDKGLGELVSAFKETHKVYPFTKLWLLGRIDKDNPSTVPEETIRKWENGKAIRYLGSTDDVRPFICQSEAVVLPSYYREGVPRSLLEAMAMGRPVITTNSVGCKEVVEEGKNGFLVTARNAQDLADTMIKFVKLPQEEREKMGSCGRQKAIKEFNEDIVIDAYIKEITDGFKQSRN